MTLPYKNLKIDLECIEREQKVLSRVYHRNNPDYEYEFDNIICEANSKHYSIYTHDIKLSIFDLKAFYSYSKKWCLQSKYIKIYHSKNNNNSHVSISFTIDREIYNFTSDILDNQDFNWESNSEGIDGMTVKIEDDILHICNVEIVEEVDIFV